MIAQGLKAVTKLGLLASLTFGSATVLLAAGDTYLASTNNLFVPKGFDDNDNSQVVLDGWLDSSCDEVQTPKHTVHENGVIEIEVKVLKSQPEKVCMPVLTRFTAVADLGVLPQGTYEIVTNNGWLVDELIVAEAASAGPDDFRYAQVDKVMVDYAPDTASTANSKWSVLLLGQYRNSCEKIEFVEVKDSGSTFEVLPVLRQEGENCLPVMQRFEYRAYLPDLQKEGRYLVHVRSAGGEAVNYVFSAFED
jgi:hypothetical protein